MRRQFPNPRELAPLVRFRCREFNARRRRLQRGLTIDDLRPIAQRRTARAPFDYADGAAEAEISLQRARDDFTDIEFHPAIRRDVSTIELSREVLGAVSALPVAFAPTDFTRMMNSEGEIAGARAAAAFGIPFTLSRMRTALIEDVREAIPGARDWFQLYLWKHRGRSLALVERAANAGYETLLVTVDVPVAGARSRDKRNGTSILPALTAGTIIISIPRAGWWFDFLTTEPLAFASLSEWDGTVADLVDTMFDPTVTFEELRLIREMWKGKLVVKGVQSLDDAVALVAHGVDGIVMSNHGGRQLDRAPLPLRILPTVVNEVGGEIEVLLDTGLMSGADVVAALAPGARSSLIGRAYLSGLMASGQDGVVRALTILSDGVGPTMCLLGVTSLDEVEPRHVTMHTRFSSVSVG